MRLLPTLAVSLAGLVSAALAQDAAPPAVSPEIDPEAYFTVGTALPDIELPTIDGRRTVRLSELRGTKLLLIQFASW